MKRRSINYQSNFQNTSGGAISQSNTTNASSAGKRKKKNLKGNVQKIVERDEEQN